MMRMPLGRTVPVLSLTLFGVGCHPQAPAASNTPAPTTTAPAAVATPAPAPAQPAPAASASAKPDFCSGPPPMPEGGGMDFARERRRVTAQFDHDKNHRLSQAERDEARAWLSAEAAKAPQPMGPPPGVQSRAAAKAGRFVKEVDFPSYPASPLFDTTHLRTLFLTFEQAAWEPELEAFFDTDVEVPARLQSDGKDYGEIGVRFRGMSSYAMVERGYKRSLNLSIDAFSPKQRLRGTKTLNLLNSAHDPTFLRTVLFLEIARKYVPALAANHVRVVVNGEYFGVYVNSQQFDTEFTQQWFNSRGGARFKVPGSPTSKGSFAYLGQDPKAYEKIYRYKGKDEKKAYQSLIKLCRVLNETPTASLEKAMSPLLDVDEVLSYLALDNVLLNGDGYLVRTGDYNLYQKPDGRFVLVHHDANETFDALDQGPGQGRRVDVEPLYGAEDPNKPLLSRLLAVPKWRTRYLERIRQIVTEDLDPKRLESRIESYRALIRDAVKTDNKKLDDDDSFERGAASNLEHPGPCGTEVGYGLLPFAAERRAYLLSHPALKGLKRSKQRR